MENNSNIYFEVKSILNKKIRTTKEYWKIISEIKHPIIKGYKKEVIKTISEPDEIRKSKKDKQIFLYYKKHKKYYVCVLVKHLNGEGFIISAYLADKIKKGETIWQKK